MFQQRRRDDKSRLPKKQLRLHHKAMAFVALFVVMHGVSVYRTSHLAIPETMNAMETRSMVPCYSDAWIEAQAASWSGRAKLCSN